jgi:hypothetical protein
VTDVPLHHYQNAFACSEGQPTSQGSTEKNKKARPGEGLPDNPEQQEKPAVSDRMRSITAFAAI